MNPFQPKSPLTVSALNRQVKQLLESQYPSVPVQGEISTLSRPASGHIYFTLKDAGGQIRCAMFKGQLARNKYQPKAGDEVIVYGRLSLYEGRGDYQLIVSSMEPVGAGALQAAFFQMKERLEKEGLFNPEHKKTIPSNVQTVGIVTSSTGAALHDILTVLERRFPSINVILYPSQVQGNEATATIVKAIEQANRLKQVDILIVGRGGGSLEDLWSFNTEPVARAIFASELPVISAVGHEVDVSISDFVADERAATPSQAAEMVSPDQYELMQQLDQLEARLGKIIQTKLDRLSDSLIHLSKRLKSPAATVSDWSTKLGELTNRLSRAAILPLTTNKQKVEHLTHRLRQASPAERIKSNHETLSQLTTRFHTAAIHTYENKKQSLANAAGQLNVLSPLATLERGYSITRKTDGSVILNSKDIHKGEKIITHLSSGKLISEIVEPD